MTVLYLVLPIGLVLSAAFLYLCVRSISGGQFDDLDTPAIRAILDDEPVESQTQPTGEEEADEVPTREGEVG
ncbi:MAG TPA: cbb3-type cytochrome oxidase assembly protein CcoS [Planctomycetes bacterium]|nr:cbb3-type cytochrome oxidase assembly protein CcoS [Planctomycetota bacterium]